MTTCSFAVLSCLRHRSACELFVVCSWYSFSSSTNNLHISSFSLPPPPKKNPPVSGEFLFQPKVLIYLQHGERNGAPIIPCWSTRQHGPLPQVPGTGCLTCNGLLVRWRADASCPVYKAQCLSDSL
ncbi:uncharacterized protein BO72DRAFT_252367 [Aspergillus fijiensis CBS 313.89]|uniref:Uncharacterized protein n=1 Tax=Aspergillus fijiensis CBS 313.89 TaxID=1448319 RepID=A0A8G1VUF7_9EURO|nr:uncharacterized protein BO72DRAFT_252367 [Aspergillus fijiensis CBS 313.89]RAK73052.1 hypothetical protein BO72DRAFT_252367 [Aspergillus fijiensis CBS 313.89]